MTKRQAERLLNLYGACALIGLDRANVDKLLRIERTLRRWAALECGTSIPNGRGFIDLSVEVDDETGRAKERRGFWQKGVYQILWRDIPNRETGALRRLRAILEPLGLYYYHQSDPRGCALYVSDKPIPDNDYNRDGIAVCID